ncbi:MAG: ABC-type phosphate/phosphonate transport system ATPase subunit [Mariniblastus sp.]
MSHAHFLPARENPLSVKRVTSISYRHRKRDWCCELSRLAELKFQAAIVGYQGSGKSTLLAELRDRLDQASHPNLYLYLPQERTEHAMLVSRAMGNCETHLVLVDGFERLTFWQRRRLVQQAKNGAGIVLTAHRPVSSLTTWIHCHTDENLMRDLLEELGLNAPEIQAAGQIAFRKSQGNIRTALRDLYDQFSSGEFNEILSR